MSKWIKRITRKEIINILNKKDKEKHIHKLPNSLDAKMKMLIHNRQKDITKKESTCKIFFSGRLKYVYITAIILIVLIPLSFFMINYWNNSTKAVKSISRLKAAVSGLSGDVFYKSATDKNWQELGIGHEIIENTSIKTKANSMVKIEYSPHTAILLEENTMLDFQKMDLSPDVIKSQISLANGILLSSVDKLAEESYFQIQTSHALFTIKGTQFLIEVDENRDFSRIAVKQGSVSVQKRLNLPKIIEQIQISKEITDALTAFFNQEIIIYEHKQLIITHEETKKTQQIIDRLFNSIAQYIEQVLKQGKSLDKETIEKLKTRISQAAQFEKAQISGNITDFDNTEWQVWDESGFFEPTVSSGEKVNGNQKNSGTVFDDHETDRDSVNEEIVKPKPEQGDEYIYNNYKSDFSIDDNKFVFKTDGNGEAGIKNGQLHLKGADNINGEQATSQAKLPINYGKNTTIFFKIKTGDIVHENSPLAVLYPFFTANDNFFKVCIMPNGFTYYFHSKEKKFSGQLPYVPFLAGRWYNLSISIQGTHIIFLINNNYYNNIELGNSIGGKRNLILSCYNECWIDDLAIEAYEYKKSFSYTNDFESDPYYLLDPHIQEWQVIKDTDNNNVIVPVSPNIKSCLLLNINPGSTFAFQFKFKRYPNPAKECWMQLEFKGEPTSDLIGFKNNMITFANSLRGDYISRNFSLDFNKWYTCKIIIKEYNTFQLFIDDKELISYTKSTIDKYSFFKFEGHPIDGNWYLDDIDIKLFGY